MKVIFMVTDADVLKRWKYIAQEDEKLLILICGPGSGKSKLIRELTFQDGWKICEARELFDDEHLKEKLQTVCVQKNVLLEHLYHKPLLDAEELFKTP